MTQAGEKTLWPADLLAGRVALVTGGTSGIGAGAVAALLAAGAQVHATGVSEAEVAAARADPRLGRGTFTCLDVRDRDAVETLVSSLDRLDIVVNCAGIIRRGEELDPEIFDQVVDINLGGAMRVSAAARPLLARSGQGAIVNIASMLSIFGGGLVPGYAASKGGISQLTKSLAIAYAPDNIRVNAVAPGWIATPLTGALREDEARSRTILARTPLGRWGEPAEIADAILYLVSPMARFVLGTTLVVDGGYSIT